MGAPRRFLLAFLLAGGLGIAATAAALGLLHRQGLLPPAPVTATWCFNEKFAFLRGAPLADRTLVAVGSSAAWRNLDMTVFEQRLPATRALNGAPCFLQLHQTTFLTRFLLDRMPRVRTVLAVLAPRDFESCGRADEAFFEPKLAGAHVDGLAPAWMVWVAGFRPFWTVREAIRLHRTHGVASRRYAQDPHGSSVLREPASYWPAPAIDARCHDALTRLEALVADRGARLVVATLPVHPAWAAQFDPDGRLIEDWTRRMAASLRRPETRLVDGRALEWDSARFADPVHLLYPNHTDFSEFVAGAMASSIARE
jgi:hypothetical protein